MKQRGKKKCGVMQTMVKRVYYMRKKKLVKYPTAATFIFGYIGFRWCASAFGRGSRKLKGAHQSGDEGRGEKGKREKSSREQIYIVV